ncbi:MAG: hypothetical protein DA405_00280 [Bacteroidetes bacterium]|nr:MAG: hypothetical protein DA405_00280 [Bacteroidota bacterium]
MKTLIYSLLGLCIGFYGTAKEIAIEKSAHVTVSASGLDRLNIDAKNTKTFIEIWDKNEISVDAVFYYRGEEDHEKIKKFMASFEENVKAGITKLGSELSINTYRAVPSKKKVGWASFVVVDLGFSDDEAKLVYNLKVPASLFMNIKHSYKDLRIKGNLDNIQIEQYSGRLSLDKVNKASLNLKYGDANIVELKEGDIMLYEQKLYGENWGDIKLNAKYSKLRIRTMNSLSGDGYETKYRFFGLKKLRGNYKYSNFEVEKMEQAELLCYEFNLETQSIKSLKLLNSKYSNYRIDTVGTLTINQGYEDDYSLQIAKNIYAADSKYSQFTLGALKGNFILSGYECKVNTALVLGKTGKIDITGKYLNISMVLNSRPYKLHASMQYGKLSYPEGLKGNYTQKGTNTNASLSSPKLGADFYTIKVSGYEIQMEIR